LKYSVHTIIYILVLWFTFSSSRKTKVNC